MHLVSLLTIVHDVLKFDHLLILTYFYITKQDVCSDDDDVDFDEIIELLKASSETHSEDDEVWESFKIEIEKRRKDFVSGETTRKVCEVYLLPTSISCISY